MKQDRMNTLSDGVTAIILTIMVLELNVPATLGSSGIIEILNELAIYLLSFMYVSIYWLNHHHMFYTIREINGKILWLNLIQLFGMSLIPFATKLVYETNYSSLSVVFYGVVLNLCAVSFYFIESRLKKIKANEIYSQIMRRTVKEKLSIILYLSGMLLGLIYPILGLLFYVVVAFIWLIPDRRIEQKILSNSN